MDHNEFLVDEDLIEPLKAFIRKVEAREQQKQKLIQDYEKEGSYNLAIDKNLVGIAGFGAGNSDPDAEKEPGCEADIINAFIDRREK